MTVRVLSGPSAGEEQIYEDTLFTDYEQPHERWPLPRNWASRIRLLVVARTMLFRPRL
jgi:hypothetical protein